MSFLTFSNDNSTVFDLLVNCWNAVAAFWLEVFSSFGANQSISLGIENFLFSLQFSDFQWKLLSGFLVTLFVNLLLVCVAWKVYGRGICERFMKPATSKAIEELKASVSKLKLPKEHTPRI